MSQVFLAFRWYFIVQVFGLAALPLTLRLFRHLPDRGYAFSKPLGLLLTGYVFWLLTTLGWLHNTAGGILVALAILTVAGLLLWSRARHQSPNSQFTNLPIYQSTNLPISQSTILITEAVFALTFVACCLVRAHMPRIETAGGEKWMEIAFLRAILRSDTFPPHDPWLSGFAISYYHFGYIIVAMLTRLAAVPPSIAFNLGVATLFALVCTGAYGLVYNLVAAGERETRRQGDKETRRRGDGGRGCTGGAGGRLAVLGGLLAVLLLAVMGNLGGLLEMSHARGLGPAGFWAWLDIRGIDGPPPPLAEGSWTPSRFFWWWQSSRVLHDYTPWGAEQEVIDEFPAFSFILGDMHPHVLALPFVLLALALAFNLYLRMMNGEYFDWAQYKWRIANGEIWEFLVYAICLGGLGFLNTWDFPIYLFIVVVAYTLAYLRATSYALRFTHYVSRFTFLFLALLVTGILLYFPFWLGFQSQAGGILPNLFNATRLPQFLVMFGPLVCIAIIFVADQARQSGVRVREIARWTLIAVLSILGALALVLGLVVTLTWLGAIPPQGPIAYLTAYLRGGPIPGLHLPDARSLISHNLLLRLLTPWTALILIALLTTIALLLRPNQQTNQQTNQPTNKQTNFVLLLFATGALLTLAVEFVYLRDHFGNRMNTVFKFYFQAWVLWAIAGAYALTGFIRLACPERCPEFVEGRSRRGRVGVVIVAALLIVAGLVYPALAIPARAREYGGPPTLDGAAYLAQTQPDDYAAIAWLNENVAGAPVILEAPGDRFKAYVYESRVSAHTGLPTPLGWGGHEHQWRGDYDEPARREPDIETIYTSVDPAEVLTLLDKYDINYVYVGPTERARYPTAGLAKFAQLMETVYDSGTVTIYRMANSE